MCKHRVSDSALRYICSNCSSLKKVNLQDWISLSHCISHRPGNHRDCQLSTVIRLCTVHLPQHYHNSPFGTRRITHVNKFSRDVKRELNVDVTTFEAKTRIRWISSVPCCLPSCHGEQWYWWNNVSFSLNHPFWILSFFSALYGMG